MQHMGKLMSRKGVRGEKFDVALRRVDHELKVRAVMVDV
jgi:hypothetical protein